MTSILIGTSADWIPAISVLAIGTVVALIVVIQLRRSSSQRAPAEPPGLAELEARRDVLVQQLRDLMDGTAPGTEHEIEKERMRLELEGASVLRAIDARKHEPAVMTEPASEKPAQSTSRGFLWGFATASALFALGVFVYRASTTRTGNTQLTGGGPPAATPQGEMTGGASEADLNAARLRVERDPNDLQARLDLAYVQLTRRELMQVFEQTQFVLEREPDNARALSYQALVRLAMGQADASLEMLKRAIASDPDLLDSWIHLALVHTQMGNFEEAKKAMNEAMRRHPRDSVRLKELLGEIHAREASLKGGGASPSAAPDPQIGAAPHGPGLSGTVDIDPSARITMGPGAVLFVIVRAEGVTTGPPVAVKRLPATMPIDFTITSADSMMGQALPPRVRLEARIDSDGNPLTRDANDPVAAKDGVALGQSARLLLSRPKP